MKNIGIGISAVAALIAAPALAADMPIKAPPTPPPAPVYSWTGYYAGLNAGGGWENTINNSATPCTDNVGGTACAVVPLPGAVPTELGTHPHGFISGGQIGYNWQKGVFVWGIETDFQGTNIKGAATGANTLPVPAAPPGVVTVTGTGSQKIDWLGTLRGRLGWLPVNPLLVYMTGGLAYGQVQTNVSFSGITAPNGGPLIPFNGSTAASQSNSLAGWTLGGGLEWMFAPHWTVKAEYLYYDLGAVTLYQNLTLTSTIIGTIFSTNIQSSAYYRGDIVRAGVNWKF